MANDRLPGSLPAGRIVFLFAALGPGMITAMANHDATGVLGYSQAGARYGYSFLWVMALSAFCLAVAQELCARMGAVTGRGLADLIREEYGVRITVLAMAALLIANFATTVANFAGILAAVTVFAPEWTRFVVLPVAGLVIWLLITRGSYRQVERALLYVSLVYISYVVSAILVQPPWGELARQYVMPDFSRVVPVGDYVFMAINVIGTTITPWGQFYVQSSIRDKGLRPAQYRLVRLDVYVGAFVMGIVGSAIIICCGATLHAQGITNIENAGQAASALAPIAGPLASALFAIGLLNASFLGAVVLPLSTAYAVTEALGWESGVGRRVREAPLFVGLHTTLIVLSLVVVLLFPDRLTTLIILPNIVGGMLLPIILVLMILLANKRRLMGSMVNSRFQNTVAWSLTGVLAVLSTILVTTTLSGR
ncbi:MAG TPA: divalent metal cation transporter [Chthonomonadales bacterium]|nr:divalent metal cation transporter [Chthonomonadales bacterium]